MQACDFLWQAAYQACLSYINKLNFAFVFTSSADAYACGEALSLLQTA